jgi:hypothetical protein
VEGRTEATSNFGTDWACARSSGALGMPKINGIALARIPASTNPAFFGRFRFSMRRFAMIASILHLIVGTLPDSQTEKYFFDTEFALQ